MKFIVKFPRTLENSQDGGTFDQHLPFAMEEPTFIQQDFDLVNLNKGVEYFYLDLKEVNEAGRFQDSQLKEILKVIEKTKR